MPTTTSPVPELRSLSSFARLADVPYARALRLVRAGIMSPDFVQRPAGVILMRPERALELRRLIYPAHVAQREML